MSGLIWVAELTWYSTFPWLGLNRGHDHSQGLGQVTAALHEVGQALWTEGAAGGRIRVL